MVSEGCAPGGSLYNTPCPSSDDIDHAHTENGHRSGAYIEILLSLTHTSVSATKNITERYDAVSIARPRRRSCTRTAPNEGGNESSGDRKGQKISHPSLLLLYKTIEPIAIILKSFCERPRGIRELPTLEATVFSQRINLPTLRNVSHLVPTRVPPPTVASLEGGSFRRRRCHTRFFHQSHHSQLSSE